MRKIQAHLPLLIAFTLIAFHTQAQSTTPAKGVFLEDINWIQAAKLLTPETVVVIPLGAQAKEHGPHMPLSADFIQSEFFAKEIASTEKVVIAPQINYGFYFPFITFPGSTSLRHSVAKNMVLDICRGLAAFGPRRFYIINEGIATNAALIPAATRLAKEGILLSFTDLGSQPVEALVKQIQQQKEGSHADEIETSKVLYMQPDKVNMTLAKREYGTRKGPGFPTPDSTRSGHYIPSGIFGDATLATREKGKKIADGMLKIMREDLARLTSAPLPQPTQDNLSLYVGAYETEDKQVITMRDDKGLICNFAQLPPEKLHFEGEDYFSGFYYEVWFKTNDAGEVTKLRLVDFRGKTTIAKKIN
jgi:creatinine amidohydrolase